MALRRAVLVCCALGCAGPAPGDEPRRGPGDPGTVTLRRLNRVEYDNTVRDLFGTTLSPGLAFPDDDEVDGFDTLGEALSLSPTYVARYADAARALVDDLYRADRASYRRTRILHCDLAQGGFGCAREILAPFAARAWRRSITEAEVETLMAPVHTAQELGGSLEEGLRASFEAVLLSPHFLFRVELDGTETPHRLTDHELASRLSYFIWSTMPDEALTAAAESGQLQNDDRLGAAIDRLLDDPRAERLNDTFATRWLEVDKLESHEVSGRLFFGRWSGKHAASMKTEVRRFFQDLLRADRPATELLTARSTYSDALLASHYGDSPRVGLLTMGAVLATTSFSTRTSPVKRGQYVLDRFLCSPLPPPPPDVEGFPDAPATPVTFREILEQHRNKPECAGCHRLMDPIGLGLEGYDAVGRHRTTERGLPIDTSGALPDETSFSGAIDLAEILARDSRVTACMTRKLATFAIGRRLVLADDDAWIDHIAAEAGKTGGGLKQIIRALVTSEAFRSRRAGTP